MVRDRVIGIVRVLVRGRVAMVRDWCKGEAKIKAISECAGEG
jgi:hypothetical protein